MKLYSKNSFAFKKKSCIVPLYLFYSFILYVCSGWVSVKVDTVDSVPLGWTQYDKIIAPFSPSPLPCPFVLTSHLEHQWKFHRFLGFSSKRCSFFGLKVSFDSRRFPLTYFDIKCRKKVYNNSPKIWGLSGLVLFFM